MNFFAPFEVFLQGALSEIGNDGLFGTWEMVKSTKRQQKNANAGKKKELYAKTDMTKYFYNRG